MTERPILFSAPMVRAILEGRKTQTRRLLERQLGNASVDGEIGRSCFTPDGKVSVRGRSEGGEVGEWFLRPRYGLPGDRLWVKETFRLRADMDDRPPSEDYWKSGAWYEADGNCEPSGCAGGAGKKRVSIHMPRWASRILLEITEVRVQRLHQISGSDAYAEGCSEHGPEKLGLAVNAFAHLWRDIHGSDSWESNPWVWALTFKRIERTSP